MVNRHTQISTACKTPKKSASFHSFTFPPWSKVPYGLSEFWNSPTSVVVYLPESIGKGEINNAEISNQPRPVGRGFGLPRKAGRVRGEGPVGADVCNANRTRTNSTACAHVRRGYQRRTTSPFRTNPQRRTLRCSCGRGSAGTAEPPGSHGRRPWFYRVINWYPGEVRLCSTRWDGP